jgi:LmbE family N-acetylglucosaminyl deacetylase
MWRRVSALVLLVCAALASMSPAKAQMPPVADLSGQIGLGLLLRQLATTGVFMQATAHPDDENNALLAALGWGSGIRTAVVTATRGDGGQNEIGPELFNALAVLRTEELLSAHRMDSPEQYFLRAVDFGFSFSPEETFEKWGRQEILGDFVRMIRTIRPDVIVAMRPDGAGGGQHHQATAILAREAFLAAGDATKFPEQLREGLRAWQAKKFYFTGRFGFPGEPPPPPGVTLTDVDLNVYDPLLGETYAELGARARSFHKTQGMAQLLALPGPSTAGFALTDTTIAGQKEKGDRTLFDGIDTSLSGLARHVPGEPPPALVEGLAAISAQVAAASQQLAAAGPSAAVTPLAAGLKAVRALRGRLDAGQMGLPDDARFEIDARLGLKERQFADALLTASAVRLEALSDDGLVVAGQPVRLTLVAANRGVAPVAVKEIGFRGFDGDAGICASGPVAPGGVYSCTAPLQVSTQARLSAPYWTRLPDAARYAFEPDAPFGAPFRPTPFRASFALEIAGTPVTVERAAQYRYEGNIFSGEKRLELLVVPRFSVTLTPGIAIVPSRLDRSARPTLRELRVTVVNGIRNGARGEVTLDLPEGWTATPASAPVAFERQDEAAQVRFTVAVPVNAKPGAYAIRAAVASGAARDTAGYQAVEYPHTRRRHIINDAAATVKLVNVTLPAGLHVGYVMGVGDQVPAAIEQLGARVTPLDADALAFGDLAKFDAIVTGVRAYERRPDLRANNDRLIAYAAAGGTVIVQYNKFEFNDAQYGPYPAKVSADRVTDERAPVQVLVPAHAVFTWPNAIGESAWQQWVQERGLYFLGDKDARYTDLVQLADPFPFNAGPKRGALVEGTVGRGHWIYVGLGLWRQLPAGTDGAYQLLANLISRGRAPTPTAVPKAPAASGAAR